MALRAACSGIEIQDYTHCEEFFAILYIALMHCYTPIIGTTNYHSESPAKVSTGALSATRYTHLRRTAQYHTNPLHPPTMRDSVEQLMAHST